MNQTTHPPGQTAKLRVCITTAFASVLLLASALPARAATFDYLGAINSKLTSMFSLTITSPSLTLLQLEQATNQLITSDPKNNPAGYVTAALVNSSFNSNAPEFARYMTDGLVTSSLARKASVAQGAITANPSMSGTITSTVMLSPNGGMVAGVLGMTSTFGSNLLTGVAGKVPIVTADQITAIAQSLALPFPIVNTPPYSSDLRIPLLVSLVGKNSTATITAIAEGVGQTFGIIYNPQGTVGVPAYDSREYLAWFGANLANQKALAKTITSVAIGLINNNPEVAPRICNDMLVNNAAIKPDAFLLSVGSVVDAEEIMEIAAALSLPPGYDSVGVSGSNGGSAYPSHLAPYFTVLNVGKSASVVAGALTSALVLKSGPTVVQDISAMAAIISNKVASFAITGDVKSLATYQKTIVSLAASVAKAMAKQAPATQQAIANAVSRDITEASKTVYTNQSLTDSTTLYSALVKTFAKITNVTAAIQTGFANPIFAWGPLNPDETPNTNF